MVLRAVPVAAPDHRTSPVRTSRGRRLTVTLALARTVGSSRPWELNRSNHSSAATTRCAGARVARYGVRAAFFSRSLAGWGVVMPEGEPLRAR